ncbi:MAG: cell wall hydrolase [Rhodobacteraceae bacterium]|nr:cell wall hydrolase [Paracoccaceae bacterium]
MLIRLISSFLLLTLLANCAPSPMETTLSSSGYTPSDHACLSEALYHEARGTGPDGLRAVGEVILNRATDTRFPGDICGVIDQRYNGSCQFSYRCDAIPNDVYNETTELERIQAIAMILLTDRRQDMTSGALYFHAASMTPGWFATLSPRGQYGGNIFYR